MAVNGKELKGLEYDRETLFSSIESLLIDIGCLKDLVDVGIGGAEVNIDSLSCVFGMTLDSVHTKAETLCTKIRENIGDIEIITANQKTIGAAPGSILDVTINQKGVRCEVS